MSIRDSNKPFDGAGIVFTPSRLPTLKMAPKEIRNTPRHQSHAVPSALRVLFATGLKSLDYEPHA